MKKLISLTLSVLLVLTVCCCSLTVSADSSKIRPDLQAAIDKSGSDDKISVCVWMAETMPAVDEMPSWPDLSAARKEYSAYIKQWSQKIYDTIFEGIDIDYLTSGIITIIKVRVSDIERIASRAAVKELSLYEDIPELPDVITEGLFLNRFAQAFSTRMEDLITYSEMYYHPDTDGYFDWVLVRAIAGEGIDGINSQLIGNRVFISPSIQYPFSIGYAVYDVQQDLFVALSDAVLNDYEGLRKVCDEKVTEGRLLGDIDNDGEISVVDATGIQRCQTGLADYPDDDEIGFIVQQYDRLCYYSDFDRDGECSITDATMIQRYATGLATGF